MQERRKSPRVKDKLVVLCEMPKGGKLERVEHSLDMSEDGLRLSIPKTVVQGDEIVVKINLLNDAIPLSLKGKVVWKKERSPADGAAQASVGEDVAGLKLSSVGPVHGVRLKRYVNRKLRESR